MKSFKERVGEALTNTGLQSSLKSGTRQARQSRANAFEWMREEGWDTEQMRETAHRIKIEILEDLDCWLDQLEENVIANNGVVYRAATAVEACDYTLRFANDHHVRSVVKSKSMVTEEIDLNERFEDAGIEVLETDLGEYIIQLAQERPSHIVAPAIHKSLADVAELYHSLFGTDREMTAAELTAWTRKRLRPKFLEADMGVSGANFAIADTGTLVIVENEGNARLATSVPRIHVAITGIEKVIRSWTDLQTLLPLLPTSATGQKITSYVSFLNGPRRTGESEGPEEFHLILLDNGRREIHSDPVFREGLACIRCGACLNACPVYGQIGGHAYGSVYQGPIGAVITPHLQGIEAAGELPFASTLCGACMDACPIKIDIPSLLIHQRHRINREDPVRRPFERYIFRIWSWLAVRASIYRRVARFGRPLVKWKLPILRWEKKSFLEQWSSSKNLKKRLED